MRHVVTATVLLLAPVAKADVAAIKKAADLVGVPHGLLEAICYKESRLKAHAFRANDGKPGNHAFGLCQIHLPTAEWLGFTDYRCARYDFSDKSKRVPHHCKLFDPFINAYWAARYLKFQIGRY